jgi:hypothetical protein
LNELFEEIKKKGLEGVLARKLKEKPLKGLFEGDSFGEEKEGIKR